jgi:glycosyltransferase involved in cell wall biosynthesis
MLFVFTVTPFPVRANGVSIRYFPLIQFLSHRYDIDIILLANENIRREEITQLKGYCRNFIFLQDPKYRDHKFYESWSTKAKFFLPWTPPISLVVDGGNDLVGELSDYLRDKQYRATVWVGPYLCPYLFPLRKTGALGRIIVDFIDSPTLWQRRRHEKTMGLSSFQRYECWKTVRWEAKVIRTVSESIYISEVDAESVPARLTPARLRHVLPNGISLDSYTTRRAAFIPGPNIGFLGNMGYMPNVEAVLWLYKEVFCPLRRTNPSLSLVIIGRDPVPSIRELEATPGVVVTGAVENVWEYINAIDIFAFPLWIGGGLKNKILEAMYAGRPVVTTDIGNEGIDALPDQEILIRPDRSGFIDALESLLRSGSERIRIGEAAHRYVAGKFSWTTLLGRFENILLGNEPEKRNEKYPEK